MACPQMRFFQAEASDSVRGIRSNRWTLGCQPAWETGGFILAAPGSGSGQDAARMLQEPAKRVEAMESRTCRDKR